jgi:hypothetical protein
VPCHCCAPVKISLHTASASPPTVPGIGKREEEHPLSCAQGEGGVGKVEAEAEASCMGVEGVGRGVQMGVSVEVSCMGM